ncbi:hypothetical protein AWZ03_003895 [Drosophila navojoa]|uniref:RING-type domain-containing protein n=1 Tax=Drosophila navojoa TaxID=7232 RepID=A0A484BLJ1_DRONA|nr:uncharacterized protein LOC108651869 [Drosophila navojoa]TDG49657.1 hypothetical protein AWZ03_003895 [Drosophila navojoa]
MFRFNGDSHRNNLVSQPTRRSRVTSGSSAAEKCWLDDHFYNLLYKSYNANNLGVNSGHRNDADKNRTSSMIDYRRIDAQLSRIQFECEKMLHARLPTENNKLPDISDHHSGREFNLSGSALTAAVRSPPPIRGAAPCMDFRLAGAPRAIPVASGPAQQRRRASTLAEISYDLPPETMLGGTQVDAEGDELPALLPFELMSSPSLCPVPEQLDAKGADSDVAMVPQADPYKCPVCLKCVRQRKPASTVCGHVFCSSCIKAALRTTCKCPLCQRVITTRQIFRIFI